MPTIKEIALVHEPKRMKNIADLDSVSTDANFILDEKRKDSDGVEYIVSYIVIDGEEYRVPASVLEQLKGILQTKPELKTFKVHKTGEGKSTKYQVIPLG